MATRKKKTNEATLSDNIVVGSHLTVITHVDGTTTLKWDDEALLNEVRAAILTAESSQPATETKPKKTKKAKA